MEYKGYKARVEVDAEAGIIHGEVEGIRDVITFEATSVDGLREAFHDSVNDYLKMCEKRGEEPEKAYSGKFLIRVDPDLHREVAISAVRAGKSLNAMAAEALRHWVTHMRVASASQKSIGGKSGEAIGVESLVVSEVPGQVFERAHFVKPIPSLAKGGWGGPASPPLTGRSSTPASSVPNQSTPSSNQVF